MLPEAPPLAQWTIAALCRLRPIKAVLVHNAFGVFSTILAPPHIVALRMELVFFVKRQAIIGCCSTGYPKYIHLCSRVRIGIVASSDELPRLVSALSACEMVLVLTLVDYSK